MDGEVKYFDIGSYAYRMKEGQQDGRKAEREKPLILIVDDDPVILRTEYAYLCEDYRVAAVSEPKDALLYLKRNKPDLVLLDYLMPRMNGGELLQKIREDDDKKVANVSVFFVTSVTDRRVVAECLSLYPQGYLLKPLNQEELKKSWVSFLHTGRVKKVSNEDENTESFEKEVECCSLFYIFNIDIFLYVAGRPKRGAVSV